MNQDLSITSLVLQASLVVQLVMAGLLLTSLASWTVIFGKLFGLKRVRASNDGLRTRVLVRPQPDRAQQRCRAEDPTARRWSASSPAACASS
jgi:biopolymer transport protein ExbB/TolQ